MSDSSVPFLYPWPERLLGDVGNVTVGGTPSTSVEKYWDGDVPWMASGDVHLRRITDVPTRITQLGLRHSNATLVPPPTVAVALAGQGKTRGTVALVLCTLCTNQSVALLAARSDYLDSTYLFHNLAFRYEELRSRSAGGGRAGLSKQLLEQVPVPLPPKAEQIKIAEILSAVDRAIEQTKALIAKQQRIKTGLMQDLLTRGIDEHGNLRSEHTHEFKDSPLGRVPVEWDVTTFEQITPNNAPIGYGIVQPGPYDDAGVKVAGIYTLNSGFRLWHMSSKQIEQAYSRSRIQAGDVLLSIKGTTGRVGVVPDNSLGNISRELARIRPLSIVNPHYLRFLMLADFFQRYLLNAEVGTTRAEISIKILRELAVVLPPKDEQNEISARLASIEHHLEAVQGTLRKHKLLKTALMQDLLTGRRRVTALLPQPGAATV